MIARFWVLVQQQMVGYILVITKYPALIKVVMPGLEAAVATQTPVPMKTTFL